MPINQKQNMIPIIKRAGQLTKLPLRTNVAFWSVTVYGCKYGRIHLE